MSENQYRILKHEPLKRDDMIYDVVMDVLTITTFPDDVMDAMISCTTELLEDGAVDQTITMSFFDYAGAKGYFDQLVKRNLDEVDGYDMDVHEQLSTFSCWFGTIYEHHYDVKLRHCIHSDQALERFLAADASVIEMLGLDKWLRDI